MPAQCWRAAARLAGACLLFLVLTSQAAAGCCDHGLLFRLDRPDAERPPNWLFGTIHSDDPRVTRLPAQVRRAFDNASVVALEVLPDVELAQTMAAAMALADGRTLSSLLPPEVYRQTAEALAERGMPPVAVERLKPWAVLLVLSMPPPRTGRFLDLELYRRAEAEGKPVRGLESPAEQIAVFDDLSVDDQVALLASTLATRDRFPVTFAALIEAYLARDLAELLRLGEELVADDPSVDARLRDVLIDQRNRRMVERLLPLLQPGGCFVAVGALHLPGAGGLLQRLDAQGFAITRVY